MMKVSELYHQADARLGNAENPKRLALVHTAIALGASFLLTLINYLFSLMIADTGGLSGLGARSALSTLQTLLELGVMVALPFWQLGIFYAALRWAKGESATFSDLLQGFRRFVSGLGLLFLQISLFIALSTIVIYACTILFMMTPFSDPLTEILAPIMEQAATSEQLAELMTPELMESVGQATIPLAILSGVLFAAVAIAAYYRVRFANFALMEGLTSGKAMIKSFAVTKRSFWKVLKIDLSFWWFYLLQGLSVAICNGDLFLSYLGISLPVSGITATILFYGMGCICQCLLLWQYEAKRVTVYGLAYRTLTGITTPDTAEETA